MSHPRKDIFAVVARITSVVAARSRLRLPAAPDVLAVCLGLTLEPRAGVRFSLKRAVCTYDAAAHSLLQRRDIGVACARRVTQLLATPAERKVLGREGHVLLAQALCSG